jgi:L-aspartate oxidase
MGGVVTDLHARSSVRGLYAVGETSCTGLHGANRLASNSLSECFVFARRAARSALEEPSPVGELRAPKAPAQLETPPGANLEGHPVASVEGSSEANVEGSPVASVEAPPRASAQTREALWRDAGIERSAEGLERLAGDPHPLARMIAASALERRESRGAHRRLEYPRADPALERRHIVVGAEGELTWETWE